MGFCVPRKNTRLLEIAAEENIIFKSGERSSWKKKATISAFHKSSAAQRHQINPRKIYRSREQRG